AVSKSLRLEIRCCVGFTEVLIQDAEQLARLKIAGLFPVRKQLEVDVVHTLAVHGELFLEIVRRSEPQTPRADLELDRGIGHAMCLNLVNKLKAVLDRAQKDVCMRQLVPHRLADQAGPRERVERGQRAGLPKRRVAAAVRQLKQLREERAFPYAAAAVLTV